MHFKKTYILFADGSKCYLIFTGLIQYVQSLHRNSLVAVVKLSHQQFHAPVAEELNVSSEQYPQMLGGIQPAILYQNNVEKQK